MSDMMELSQATTRNEYEMSLAKDAVALTVSNDIKSAEAIMWYDDHMMVLTEYSATGACGYYRGKLACCKNAGSEGEDPTIEYISDVPMYIMDEIRDDRGNTYFRFVGRGAIDGRYIDFTMNSGHAVNNEKFRAMVVREGGARNSFGKITLDKVQNATSKTRLIHKITRPVFKDGTFTVPGLHENDTNIYDLSRYCPLNVCKTDYKNSLRAMLDIHPKQILNLTAILAAPYVGAFYKDERFGYALWGQTGTFKTTTLQLTACVFGTDYYTDRPWVKWGGGSTKTARTTASTECGIFFIPTDNLKAGDAKSQEEYVQSVQTIVEGDDKARAKKDGGLLDTAPIECMLLVSGEVKPEEAATSARVLGVNWSSPDVDKLTQAQRQRNKLPGVGYDWLMFLESNPEALDYEDLRYKLQMEYQQRQYANAGRLAGIGAIMEVVFDLMLKSPFGDIIQEHQAGFRVAMDEVITDQGLAVTCETDANRFLRVVRQLYTSRPQMFNEKLDYDVYSNGKVQNTPIIGWITKKLGFDEGLFLLPDFVCGEI